MDVVDASRRRSGRAACLAAAALVGLVALLFVPDPAAALSAPVVALHPGSRVVPVGTAVSFTSTATGDPEPTVQWQRSTSGTWADISGATSTTYSFTPQLVGVSGFRAVFTNSEGTATSAAASLSVTQPVNQPPVITLHPQNQTVLLGNPVTFTAGASGWPPPSVQWQRGTTVFNHTTWVNITGATSTSYTFTPGTGSNTYRAVFTNLSGQAISNSAFPIVHQPASIVVDPASDPARFPLTSPTVTHQRTIITDVDGTPFPTIVWERSSDGGATWTPAVNDPGFTNNEHRTVTLGSADDGTLFRVTATNQYATVSKTILARVGVPPTVVRHPRVQYVATGSTATYLSEGASSTPMTVQWSTTPTAGPSAHVPIPGGTSPTVTLTAPGGNHVVRVTYTNDYGSASAEAHLRPLPAVDPPGVAPYVITLPVEETSVELGQSVTLSATAGGDPTPSVQWQRLQGTSYVDIPGATENDYTYTATSNASSSVRLRPRFTNAAGYAEDSTTLVWILYAPHATAGDTTKIAPLLNATSTVSTTMQSGLTASPTPTYQWQVSTDGGATWANATGSGATNPSYTVQAGLAHNLNQYRAIATNPYGSAIGPVTTLKVGIRPTFSQNPTSQTVVVGTTASFSVVPDSPTAYTLRWERSLTSNGTYVDVPACAGVATCSFTATSADDGYWYRAFISNEYQVNVSGPAKLTVTTSVPTAPTNVTATPGSTRADVSWTPPSTDGGHAISTYVVTPWKDGVAQTPTAIAAPATGGRVDGLTNGSAYTFTVAAVNALGTGPASAPSAAVTPTGVVLSSNVDSSVVGQAVTLRVDSTIGTTGTVRFYDGATLLGTKSLSAGAATLVTTKLAVGSHVLVATYQRTSTSPIVSTDPLTQVVGPGGTTTAVTSDPASATFGQSVKLRASVGLVAPAAGTRTGSVRFYEGDTLLGTASLSANAATLTVRLGVGSHPITAVYAGSTSWAGSTSDPYDLVVAPGATSTTVTSSVNPSVAGQSTTIKTKVVAVAPATGTVTGSVELREGGVIVATKVLTGGAASFSLKPTVGVHDYELVFTGSATYAGSSGTIAQTVDPASSKVVVTSAKPVAAAGASGSITATVTNVAPGAGLVTGTVEFSVGGVVVHTAAVSSTGKATMPIALLSPGVHEVVATYLGDASHHGSTSAPFTQTIT